MKKIKLSDGRSVQIGTQFGEERPVLERPLPPELANKPFRSVRLRLTVFDQEGKEIGELTGVSYCNPGDRYDRIKGRKKATKRLFEANCRRSTEGNRQRELELLRGEDCRALFPVLHSGRVPEPAEVQSCRNH